MTASERLVRTLNFENVPGGGACMETFFPWTLTVSRWLDEGLPAEFRPENLYPKPEMRYNRYFNDQMTDPVYRYEQFFGLDGVKRMSFRIPFKCFDEEILTDCPDRFVRLDEDGWERVYYKQRQLITDRKPVVADEQSWQRLKKRTEEEVERYCTEKNLKAVYSKYASDQKSGKSSIRFRASGFFWTARELMGAEEELLAFCEAPELLHEINDFVLEQYLHFFDRILSLIQPEVLLFEEDLSGKNGPMISPEMFDEFVGRYYAKLIPMLKSRGVRFVFVDTDGNFEKLIPNFIACGVDGFLPMDVNAGMDIVRVRERYPTLRFIGAFNKLMIAQGAEAIDREFERLRPVIRQGGYVPGADHQVAPSTSLADYQYYLRRLKLAMQESGADHRE